MLLRWIYAGLLLTAFIPATTLKAQLFENEYNYSQLKASLLKLSQSTTKLSVDELIPELKKTLPLNLRSRYLLIHDSRSLQQATPDSPRIILFSDDAKFIISMAGKNTMAGGNTLEIIEYNNAKEGFDFYQIDFDKHGKIQFHDGTELAKPSFCIKCHGANPRPNWNPYDLWPAAYGSLDDQIPVESPEAALFKNFISKYAHQGRYQLLEGMPSRFDLPSKNFLSISSKPEIYSHINSNEWKRVTNFDANYTVYARPNYKFTQEVGRLTLRQAAKRMLGEPMFPQLAGGIFSALYFCDANPIERIPKELQKNPNLNLKEYVERTNRKMKEFRLRLVRESLVLFGKPDVPYAEIEKKVWSGEAIGQSGNFGRGYSSLEFSPFDATIIARLQFVFDTVGIPFYVEDYGNFQRHDGPSYTFGNTGIKWLSEALLALSSTPLPKNCGELPKP